MSTERVAQRPPAESCREKETLKKERPATSVTQVWLHQTKSENIQAGVSCLRDLRDIVAWRGLWCSILASGIRHHYEAYTGTVRLLHTSSHSPSHLAGSGHGMFVFSGVKVMSEFHTEQAHGRRSLPQTCHTHHMDACLRAVVFQRTDISHQ